MNLDFFKFGGEKEPAPASESCEVEKEKKIIEANKRQQDKLIASLLTGNKDEMAKDEVEVNNDERDSFLMKLVAGEISQMKVQMLINSLVIPIKILGAPELYKRLLAVAGSENKLRSFIFNASRGQAGLNSLLNPTDLEDLAKFSPLPKQAQEALSKEEDVERAEMFIKGFYGKRYEYSQQAEALRIEAEEKFGKQE
jgi:hypothetical protein